MFLQYLNRFWMHWGQKEDDFDGTSLARVWHEFGTELLLGTVLRSRLQLNVECTKMSLKVAQGCQHVAQGCLFGPKAPQMVPFLGRP